jgi:hypothetical protein
MQSKGEATLLVFKNYDIFYVILLFREALDREF